MLQIRTDYGRNRHKLSVYLLSLSWQKAGDKERHNTAMNNMTCFLIQFCLMNPISSIFQLICFLWSSICTHYNRIQVCWRKSIKHSHFRILKKLFHNITFHENLHDKKIFHRDIITTKKWENEKKSRWENDITIMRVL